MKEKKRSVEYKRKYELFRHHAWAGLGLLTVFLALRYFIPSIPLWIFLPVGSVLIIYSLIGLLGTYRYSAGLTSPNETMDSITYKKYYKTGNDKSEKMRVKLEKKKLKTEVKKIKKTDKKR